MKKDKEKKSEENTSLGEFVFTIDDVSSHILGMVDELQVTTDEQFAYVHEMLADIQSELNKIKKAIGLSDKE